VVQRLFQGFLGGGDGGVVIAEPSAGLVGEALLFLFLFWFCYGFI